MAIEKVELPAARKIAKLTQAQLAKAVGVSISTVYKWEIGEREPTITQAKLICKACGRTIDEIIFLPKNTV